MANADQFLARLWALHDLPQSSLSLANLGGRNPCLASSFAVTSAAQSSIAAAALAAIELGRTRGLDAPRLSVAAEDAAAECTGFFAIDGDTPPTWAPLSGLYQCADGWLRIHANFDHHRDCALRALGLPEGENTAKETLASRLLGHPAIDAEQAINLAGGAASAARTRSDWEQHPQAQAISALPLVEFTRIGDAPAREWPAVESAHAPLSGIRMLDLTRILAGPVAGRTLAAYGADVMLINSPALPNIDAIADTSRGKLSAQLDFNQSVDRATLDQLLQSSHVFVQGYRPGSLAGFDLGAEQIAERSPGIVCVSLSAYGRLGPWADRRGFDSLVQTAAGLNYEEAVAAGSDQPRPMPVQILDYASGFLMAFGTSVALRHQQLEGGSWHVQVSLARTAQWLREQGRNADDLAVDPIDPAAHLQDYESGFGKLTAVPHAAKFDDQWCEWRHLSKPPGSDPARWPARTGD
jgi:crotonobetainyl-CoA:carnitine CoA-transferase CaiB-like acyl-CoA transferase